MSDELKRVSTDNVAYLREWAADIRKHSGKSVGADRCDKIADEIATLRRERDVYRRMTGQMMNPPDKTADIVERLRHEHITEWGVLPALLMADAADEIERLRDPDCKRRID